MVCVPLTSTARAEAGEELTVRVLTIEAGNHPLFTLGESALWIQDERASRGFVYDFGAVKPDSVWSALAWLAGRMTNRVSRVPIDEALERYRRQHRSVETQELDIVPAARLTLQRELERASLPESREYRYDPFLNSGTTWVRDAVDRAAGGRVRAARPQGRATGSTLRQQAREVARDWFPAGLLVELAQGGDADRPLEHWERLVSPRALQDTLRRIGQAGSWNASPLIASEGTIVAGPPAPSRQAAEVAGRRLLLIGLLLGTALAFAGRAARRRPALRSTFAALLGMIGMLFGLIGAALLLGSFSGPLARGLNENIFQSAPWGIVLPFLAAGVAAGRPDVTRRAFWVTGAATAVAAVGLLGKATPWFRQDNWRVIGLFLPIWAGLALGLWSLHRR